MKKNSFLKGAFIATFAIVITKILGIIYVIPFYSLIGESGGTLYAYGYTIYSMFLSISTVGVPLGISKIVCEYNALGYTYSKVRAYKIGRKLMIITSILIFLFLFIFAKQIAISLVKDGKGLNSIKDVTLVIRTISTAILFVPTLSVTRGFLQGHRYIKPSSMSQVVEQFIRVIIIIAGSFIVMKWLKLGTTVAVSVAVFGATAGAIGAYFYLFDKIRKHKSLLLPKTTITKEEKGITAREIILKVIMYATPFIMIEFSKSIINFIDLFTVRTEMIKLGYDAKLAEVALSVVTTWSSKINVIVITISAGILTSLIPHITNSYIKKDYDSIRNIINQSLQIVLFLALPMAIGLSFLAKPVWMIFYGNQGFSASIYAFDIIVAFFSCFYSISIGVMQSMNKYKMVAAGLLLGVSTKLILQIPMMEAFSSRLGINPIYGSDFSTMCSYIVPSLFLLSYFVKLFKINYDETIKRGFAIFVIIIVMLTSLFMFRYILPLETSSRLQAVLVAVLYSIFGGSIYIFFSYKFGVIKKIFSERVINMVKERFIKKKDEVDN